MTRRPTCPIAMLAALLMVASMGIVRADEPHPYARLPTADTPAWPASPYHGVTDGDGRIIPCRCRFREREYVLGARVCMETHVGIVIARCDLVLNNTSWVRRRRAAS